MCTVTFIPRKDNKFVLTSNRDESPSRNTLPPDYYQLDSVNALYPKDEIAGGTWIGVSSRSRLLCLLNGGFEAHVRQESYRVSRGVIVKELLKQADAITYAGEFDFENVEPFTLIVVDWEQDLKLHELVWDGSQLHIAEKPLSPHIWSSSLLYPKPVKLKRVNWFSEFLFEHLRPNDEQLLHFHKTAGEGDPKSNLIMDIGFVATKSITQVSVGDEVIMRYEDLQTGSSTEQQFT